MPGLRFGRRCLLADKDLDFDQLVYAAQHLIHAKLRTIELEFS